MNTENLVNKAAVALLSGALLITATQENALAYRQTKTCLTQAERNPDAPTNLPTCGLGQSGWPVRWPTREVPYWVNKSGHDSIIEGVNGEINPELLNVVRSAIRTWSDKSCSDFTFKYQGLTDTSRHAPEDGINVVTWVDDGWATSSATIALTSTTMTQKGVLVDADMEFNVLAHRFSISDTPASGAMDLANTTTHEAGHMLGLDEAPEKEATMYYSASTEESKKRDLHPDDVAGLCAIYPVGVPNVQYSDDTGSGQGTCDPDTDPDCTTDECSDGGCCCTTAQSKPLSHKGELWLLGLGLTLMAARRRRKRASH